MIRWLVGIAIAAGFVALLWSATFAGAGVHCEACVVYEGRHACKSATGDTREDAEQAAMMTACALVSGGVTGSIACQATVPQSMHCTER